jgi:recombinational DNA repair protein (RecF pathway)
MVLAMLGVTALVTSCCHSQIPTPPPRAEYGECRHPKLGEVDACLKDCDGAPAEAKATCRRGCCGLINDISQATEQEKDALRRCRTACE